MSNLIDVLKAARTALKVGNLRTGAGSTAEDIILSAIQLVDAHIARLESPELVEVVGKAIVTCCVVEELSVEPMPDQIAYALAKAAIDAVLGV